jgi:hypothetical protein
MDKPPPFTYRRTATDRTGRFPKWLAVLVVIVVVSVAAVAAVLMFTR